MMPNLTSQRCFNHATREAAARCPECARFFCRECITEHDERVLCAGCLKKTVRVPLTQRGGFIRVLHAAQFAFGLLLAWFFFFLIGERLLRLPESFHENSVWGGGWMDRK
jgi:hypothetical protein